MKRKIILLLLRALARSSRSTFFENVDLKLALEQVADDGIAAKAHGFVFESKNLASGVYLIDYNLDILENKYGRYN